MHKKELHVRVFNLAKACMDVHESVGVCHFVHTTHVSSLVELYGGQGSTSQLTSTV